MDFSRRSFGVNVLDDSGIMGDGVTDDTDAIQSKLWEQDRKGARRKLLFPTGIYGISRPLVIPGLTMIEGEHVTGFHTTPDHLLLGTTFFPLPSFTGDALMYFPSRGDWQHSTSISNIALQCNNQVENGAIIEEAGEGFLFHNIRIQRALDTGLKLVGTQASFTGTLLSIHSCGKYGVNMVGGGSWGGTGGTVRLELSGDDHGIAEIRVGGWHNVSISGWKSEGQKIGVLIDAPGDTPKVCLVGASSFNTSHADATVFKIVAGYPIINTASILNTATNLLVDERPGKFRTIPNSAGQVSQLIYEGLQINLPGRTLTL